MSELEVIDFDALPHDDKSARWQRLHDSVMANPDAAALLSVRLHQELDDIFATLQTRASEQEQQLTPAQYREQYIADLLAARRKEGLAGSLTNYQIGEFALQAAQIAANEDAA